MIGTSIFLGISLKVVGYIIFIGAFLILHLVLKYYKNKIVSDIQKSQDAFKKTAERIPIFYNELEIKTNSWKQEITVGSGTQSRNEYLDVNFNIIILSKTHRGHHFNEQYEVHMEPEILRMKLAYQNELSFYFNPVNYDDNFLDLQFL